MLLLTLIFLVLEIVILFFFWTNILLTILLLVSLLVVKHKLLPIKKEYLWFILAGLIGTFGEGFIMLRGPWAYSAPTVLNFPLWLFFAWGLAGCIGVSLYKAIENNS